ncbi:MAG TPA: response regulator [Desulfuromonadaceae bacterium]|jgi:signal transduction histidine kinase
MNTTSRVLIIDDTPEIIDVLREILCDDYDVIATNSGLDALQVANSESPPDLILLDVRMPLMDGYEICAKLKSEKTTNDIPVIFITAMADIEDERKGLEMGAVDYIYKPFTLPLVKARIKNQLDLKIYRDQLGKLVEQRTIELSNANQQLQIELNERKRAKEALAYHQSQLEILNQHLEQRINDEIEKNRKKDRLMLYQARFSIIGEMMGNIAHQWRQPLNNIGLLIQSSQLEFEDNNLDNDKYSRYVSDSMNILNYLSLTIDNFRNFFKPDAGQHLFSPFEMVEKAVSLVRAGFQHHLIGIDVKRVCPDHVLGYSNEFSQIILILLNNAKDALIKRALPEPRVEISCYKTDNRYIISVSDNAGGVADNIIEKIFDPYFTTKFMAQGTGVGLYMAKMIIEKSMGGTLIARNTSKGAEFIIELPTVK